MRAFVSKNITKLCSTFWGTKAKLWIAKQSYPTTPDTALLCKACKRLTKLVLAKTEFLHAKLCKLCMACKRLRRVVLPPYKALLCKACKPKVCTKFLEAQQKLCKQRLALTRPIQSLHWISLQSVFGSTKLL